MDSLEIRPDAANGAPSEPAQASTSFERSESGSATARLTRPAHIAIGPFTMTVAAARAIALAGLAVVALAALVAGAPFGRAALVVGRWQPGRRLRRRGDGGGEQCRKCQYEPHDDPPSVF